MLCELLQIFIKGMGNFPCPLSLDDGGGLVGRHSGQEFLADGMRDLGFDGQRSCVACWYLLSVSFHNDAAFAQGLHDFLCNPGNHAGDLQGVFHDLDRACGGLQNRVNQFLSRYDVTRSLPPESPSTPLGNGMNGGQNFEKILKKLLTFAISFILHS